ncbi:DUF6252 family protein [Bizionia paragorgiae]|uniref:Lipoprotein n=1 Tax=Bizionia paragorgiae TaxID=283786 RepID=A0A1H4BLX5_BIZPA|nr:DUF6252 family protein [Bizionia paragorgiae]SEA49048.1 hypothetical protein SAMN04487990_11531 [Bizionia paragorgiae]
MKNLLLAFAMLLIVSNCNKNDDDQPTNPIDQLPPATQTGANTFGFLANGEPINVTNTSQQVAIYQGGILQIGGGIDNTERDISVSIIMEDPININTSYDLTNFPVHAAKFRKRQGTINCNYAYEDTYQGSMTLTNIDTTNFIVSGTFEFSTVTDDCENINITNGRFDLQYIP